MQWAGEEVPITHTAEAMGANQVWAVDVIGGDRATTNVYPYLMASGTTVAGPSTRTAPSSSSRGGASRWAV